MATHFLRIFIGLLLWIGATALDTTICDCENTKSLGLLDASLPNYCDHAKNVTQPLRARYEVWMQNRQQANGTAFVCQRWIKEKHVVGYFPHTFDTTFRTHIETLSMDECWLMVHSKQCGNQLMFQSPTGWSYTAEPQGDGEWLAERTYAITNCDLTELSITRSCPECALESPLGVLHQTNGRNYLMVGRTTVVWTDTVFPARTTCTMIKSRQGQRRYWEATEDRLGRLVADDAEFEYLFIKSHGSLHCRVDRLIPVSGQSDVFLRIFPMRQEPIQANTSTAAKDRNRRSPDENEIRAAKVTLKAGQPASGVLFHKRRCLVYDGTVRLATKHCLLTELDRIPTFTLFPDGSLKRDANLTDCVTREYNVLVLRPCGTHVAQHWTYNPVNGALSSTTYGLCAQYNESLDYVPTLKCTGEESQRWEFLRSAVSDALDYLQRKNYSNTAMFVALNAMDQIDGTSSGNANIDKANNRLAENFDRSIVLPNEFASHNQFVEGRAIERENLLADELRRVQCLALRTRTTLAYALAPMDGLLAAQYLRLGTCQRLDAAGANVMVQQCVPINITVNATLSRKCGFQPTFNGSTLSRNGLTLVPFTECFWTHDRANIGGRIHVYREGDWQPVPFQLTLPPLGDVPPFQEGIDHSAQYFPVAYAAHETKPIEQVDLLGQIMARMQESAADSASSIILSPEQSDFLPSLTTWWQYIKYGFLGLVSLIVLSIIVWTFCCLCRIIVPPIRKLLHSTRRLTPVDQHSHTTPKFHRGVGFLWEDGCPLTPLRGQDTTVMTSTALDTV